MGAADSNGPAVQRGSARRSRPRPPRAGSLPQAGLRAREWRPAPPMPRLPMRLHSGVLRHLTSPTVAGAAPALQFAKATRAPDSRLNHRNSGSHLRGAHGSRIGPGRLRGLRQAAKRNASPRVWMANGRFLLPPGEGAPKGRMRVRSEASCHGWKQHAGAAGMSACVPPSVTSHMRVGFAPVPSPQPPLRAPARACGAGAPRHARPWRASCASSPRRERGFGQLRHDRVQHFSKSRQLEVAATTCRGGSVAGDWRRAAHGCAATASQTGCLPSRRADPRPR